ncbi:substrate-binding periplasmic protein [Pseudoduganella sp. OTU4001]|uniref:substrate-binding periplasmic protein n=1 Tax=Pseudoduganella sp. OTU4001 TaxID=3043854 RepID=UPI00313B9CDD
MKALATLLCALFTASAQGQDLVLYIIPDTPAHMEAWQIVQSAAQRAGIGVALRPLPPRRGMVMANKGELDGAIGRTMLAARDFPDLVPVPESIFNYAPSAWSYKQFDVAGGWNALRGHTLCVRKGYSLTDVRTRHLQRQSMDSDDSLLRMLRRGGCDVAIMDRNNKAGRAAMAADQALYLLQPPLEEAPLYLFLHKRHAGLVGRLSEALRQVKRE